MYPSKLPPEIRQDTRRAAECRVYDALKQQLSPDYHVFYSSPWHGTRPDGTEVDGEADFIVAHPDLGMLVIEVKGGRITIDADGQWRSTDRDGITYKIKNPVKQARDSKHELRKKIKKSRLWKSGWIIQRHGVILSDVARPERDLRPDMPLKIFAFLEDMPYLDQWVNARFSATAVEDREGRTAFGANGINALVDLVARPIQLQTKLGSDIEQDIRALNLLTNDQLWTLKELESNNRMAIAGAAGTGKTILAVKKAINLAEAGYERVLLLCFNRPLALRLAEMVSGFPGIEAANFHQFCRDCLRAAGQSVADADAQLDKQYSDTLAVRLLDAFADADIEEYDAVIIDEGQDFRDSWLRALECVVRGGKNGILYIFYDNNQNVMSRSGDYIRSLKVVQWHLSKNFRNTRAVFNEADRFYKGDFVRPIGPSGSPVNWKSVNNLVELKKYLSERVGDLINNEGVLPEDIAVLVPDRSFLEDFGSDRIGRYRTSAASPRVRDRVVMDTVRRFKGLESPVVLLVLSSGMQDETDVMYTGITRSRSVLDIIGLPGVIERMRA